LVCLTTNFDSFAQAKAFSFINQPVVLNATQTKMLTKANTDAHVGEVKFVRFTLEEGIDQNSIKFALPSINNGNVLTFTIQNAIYDSPTHYSLSAKGDLGSITLYITPDAIGGTIDLFTKLYVLYPIGDSKGILVEKNLSEGGNSKCGETKVTKSEKEIDFCVGDCGEAILDILILRTPEANTWLNSTFGWLANWFLFVEGHNMNLALVNSLVPNKRVRVSTVDYTPDFAWSAVAPSPISGTQNILNDRSSISASSNAATLMSQNQADIAVLLTNNNYLDIQPATPTMPAVVLGQTFGITNSLDPLSTNKIIIAEVPFIDPIRYTIAHEVAHQFGCMHSDLGNGVELIGCPHGTNMANGRNTIVANNSGNNTRIPHYSNPAVSFGGEVTGIAGLRDNAQQIRTAFCESANNFPIPKYGVSVSATKICKYTYVTFTSSVVAGDCNSGNIGIPGLVVPVCGLTPYTYKWEKSLNSSFSNPNTIGTGANVTLFVYDCNGFYIRLTVTSSNGFVTSATNYYNCASSGCFSGGGQDREEDFVDANQSEQSTFIAFPNPAHDEVTIVGKNVETITNVDCYNTQGKKITLNFLDAFDQGQVRIPTSFFVPGLYFFSIKGTKTAEVLKVVIQ
jgi:hypothetical protein